MKKLLFAFPIVTLLAAGCNSSQQATNQIPAQSSVSQNTNPTPTHSPIPTPTPTPTPATTQNQAVPANWATYTSSDLGLSFKYPTDLKVYQQDANDILIQANYQNSQHPLATIEMSIKKTNSPQLLTEVGISGVNPSGTTTTVIGTQSNYQALKVTNQYHSRYYFLDGKVTFIVDDNLDEDVSLQTFTQQSDIYQTYTAEFDTIRSSIIFN